jgi:hypothetical protein
MHREDGIFQQKDLGQESDRVQAEGGDYRHTFRRVPAFFRSCCNRMKYHAAGYQLARHLGGVAPDGLGAEEWQGELDKLAALLFPREGRNHRGVWEWFVAHFPRCAALIPPHPRELFVKGVCKAADDGQIRLDA